MGFDHTTTTDEVLSGIDLAGKTAVITGASAGLGIETARALASVGARVVMLARNPGKLSGAASEVRSAVEGADIETGELDLASLDSVRACAADLLGRFPEIHLLINNAGVMACPLARTADGFELQFGTNHVGHFLLTNLLVPALEAGAPSRVICLSSGGHRFAGMDFEDPNYHQRDYEKWQAYGQSKTANALFAVELDARLKDAGVRAFSVHPGMIVTELGRHLEQSDIEMISARAKDAPSERGMKSIPQGAATSVWAATSAALDGRGGLYLEDCQVADPGDEDGFTGVMPHAVDPEAAKRLWALTEDLVGQRFPLGSEQ